MYHRSICFLASCHKNADELKRSLFIKKLVSQNAPRKKKDGPFFSTSKREKEQHERKKKTNKKKISGTAASYNKKKRKERDAEAREDSH